MKRILLPALVVFVFCGCCASRQPPVDPFYGRTAVAPPGTGAVCPQPVPYYSGAPAAGPAMPPQTPPGGGAPQPYLSNPPAWSNPAGPGPAPVRQATRRTPAPRLVPRPIPAAPGPAPTPGPAGYPGNPAGGGAPYPGGSNGAVPYPSSGGAMPYPSGGGASTNSPSRSANAWTSASSSAPGNVVRIPASSQ